MVDRFMEAIGQPGALIGLAYLVVAVLGAARILRVAAGENKVEQVDVRLAGLITLKVRKKSDQVDGEVGPPEDNDTTSVE